ncbi:hypothetical protein J7F03_20665 [Streptomyces sp. ISL-43]|uniref:hypothetical protein n=1 Tax=Streptomyces sp. ISL-43 TaxID=2819183 RepID=UPI001BE670B9|nr:hypothetical protein [Streptomyces sp. ISL-43]MBT2449456.1 hypothetical protein [Streptomyces sp. ISL-43]
MTAQPARHTVDTITSDDLDQLYAERDELTARASVLAAKWGYAFGLLARAVDWLPESDLRDRIRASLDEPKASRP